MKLYFALGFATLLFHSDFGNASVLNFETLKAIQSSGENATGGINQIGLELHNKYRRIHYGTPDLVIEKDILSFDDIAQRLKGAPVVGRPINMNEMYGENEAYIDGAENEEEAVKKAIEMWYEEGSLYDYDNPGYSDETRHFSQLVWKSTTEFAMGVFRFESGDPNWNTYFVMARYNPQGNVDGMYTENVLPPKN